MPINVLVNGAFGRMGQITVKAIEKYPGLVLVGQTTRDYDLPKAIKDSRAQVVVDFTHPDVVYENTRMIIEAGSCPVIGTSGLKLEQINTLQELAQKLNIGGIIAPNFSLGAVLMMKYAKEIAKYLPDVEIIEMHHDKKIDSPSGTAMRTAEILATARATQKPISPPDHETVAGARGANYHGIPIHAVRLPGLLAHQEILFGSTGETLLLRHDALDRQCFMHGVCIACEKAVKLDRLVYGLEEVL